MCLSIVSQWMMTNTYPTSVPGLLVSFLPLLFGGANCSCLLAEFWDRLSTLHQLFMVSLSWRVSEVCAHCSLMAGQRIPGVPSLCTCDDSLGLESGEMLYCVHCNSPWLHQPHLDAQENVVKRTSSSRSTSYDMPHPNNLEF